MGPVVSTHRFSVDGWTAWEALLLAGKWFRNKRGKNARRFICLVLRVRCELERVWGYTSMKMEENQQCISAIPKKNWRSRPFKAVQNFQLVSDWITQSMIRPLTPVECCGSPAPLFSIESLRKPNKAWTLRKPLSDYESFHQLDTTDVIVNHNNAQPKVMKVSILAFILLSSI